ncbi:hypothetical protein L1887_61612 [Cichorium endivia]|nr:hypothetical protein L1887_61612 [Cichorium endivia]
MSALRSPSLSEKAAGSPKDDGSVSPHSQRRMTARVYPSGDTLDVAALGRLSSSSRRRSASNGDDLSLSNILAQGPPHVPETEAEPEIRVVKVPFNLTPGQQMAPAHESDRARRLSVCRLGYAVPAAKQDEECSRASACFEPLLFCASSQGECRGGGRVVATRAIQVDAGGRSSSQ